MRLLAIVSRAAVLVAALSIAASAAAHGLIQDPPSRNWFCGFVTKPDEIGTPRARHPECAGAFQGTGAGGYQFMSVLTHARGRSVVRPLPNNVCGFNSETFNNGATPWDAAINWPTSPITAGPRVFTWNISWGPHFDDTEEFRYWITKPEFAFQVGRPLSWADFEEAPFCVQNYNDANPGGNPNVVPDKASALFKTTCNVPARSGRHVIYGEWGRNQFTLERFHGCMDVVFQASGGGNAVKSVITTQPALGSDFSGAGTVLLDGRGSQGNNLSYRWTVSAPNNALYTLDTPNAATTTLRLANPTASQSVQIGLQISSGSASDNSTLSFTHKPGAVASVWRDLGALTPLERALKAGDSVQLRAVTASGQDLFYPATPITLSAANAGAAAWPVVLAEAVNIAAGGTLRVGLLGTGDQVNPVPHPTNNRVYATTASGIGSAFLIVTVAPPGGGGGISASYTVFNDWQAGYCANIAVRNNGTQAVTWTASMPVEGRVTQLWNASWSQTGSSISFSGPSWAATLQPGASFLSAGFCATR
jgi:chitin-binding protein